MGGTGEGKVGGEMTLSDETTIQKLLQDDDKVRFAEYVRDRIGDAEKCLIVFGVPDGKGGIDLKVRQIGFKYLFEIQGFLDCVAECFDYGGEETTNDDGNQ
jgi:hypothetical protein